MIWYDMKNSTSSYPNIYKNLAGPLYPQYKWPGDSRREMPTLREERERCQLPTSLSGPFVWRLGPGCGLAISNLSSSRGLTGPLRRPCNRYTKPDLPGPSRPRRGQLAIWFIRFGNFWGNYYSYNKSFDNRTTRWWEHKYLHCGSATVSLVVLYSYLISRSNSLLSLPTKLLELWTEPCRAELQLWIFYCPALLLPLLWWWYLNTRKLQHYVDWKPLGLLPNSPSICLLQSLNISAGWEDKDSVIV